MRFFEKVLTIIFSPFIGCLFLLALIITMPFAFYGYLQLRNQETFDKKRLDEIHKRERRKKGW